MSVSTKLLVRNREKTHTVDDILNIIINNEHEPMIGVYYAIPKDHQGYVIPLQQNTVIEQIEKVFYNFTQHNIIEYNIRQDDGFSSWDITGYLYALYMGGFITREQFVSMVLSIPDDMHSVYDFLVKEGWATIEDATINGWVYLIEVTPPFA